jgi:hypothetical protein
LGVIVMTMSMQAPNSALGPTDVDIGTGGSEGTQRRGKSPIVLILVAALSAVIAAVAGGLVGYSMGRAEVDEQAAVVTDLRAEIADTQSATAVLEDRLTSSEQQVAACLVTASLAQQIIENRQADLAFLSSGDLPEDLNDPAYDEMMRRDAEFTRLVGQFDVAAAACVIGTGEATSAAVR